MKQMRNKVNALSIALVLALLTGCGGAEDLNSSQAAESALVLPLMTSVREAAKSVDPETVFGTEEESRIEEENPSEEEESTLRIDREDIVNYDEAYEGVQEEFWNIYGDIEREAVLEGAYSDNFPVELQDILFFSNDDVFDDRDEKIQEYAADLEYIYVEEGEELYEEIAEVGYEMHSVLCLHLLDIDGDGEDEYVEYIGPSVAGASWTVCVFKDFDGKIAAIGGREVLENFETSDVLEYEGKYYIQMGNRLTCWDDEAEIPDYEYWRNMIYLGLDDCWSSIVIRKNVTGYIPYELYSSLPEDTTDYLKDVDMAVLQDSGMEAVEVSGDFSGLFYNTLADYGWERVYGGEKYTYFVSDIWRYGRGEYDKYLTVLHETEEGKQEIVKVYYMAANYAMEIHQAQYWYD